MSEQKMKKSRSWSSYCRKEPGSCYKRQLRMRLSTISNSTRTDGMKMDGGWWSAMDICRSGRWFSGVGPIRVRQPRVRHRDKGRFSSAILPKYMRRSPSVDALIPALYLKGISTGDFSEALTAILGQGASGLSATNIVRLKSSWEADYKAWSQ